MLFADFSLHIGCNTNDIELVLINKSEEWRIFDELALKEKPYSAVVKL